MERHENGHASSPAQREGAGIAGPDSELSPLQWLRSVESAVRRRGVTLPRQEAPQTDWLGMAFHVADTPVVVPLDQVRELFYCPRITRIPGCRAWVKGLASVRGRLLTVVDLSAFMTGSTTSIGPRSRVLAVRGEEMPVGLLLESFAGLRHLGEPQAQDRTQPGWLAPYATGKASDGHGEWTLLDTARLLDAPEFRRIAL